MVICSVAWKYLSEPVVVLMVELLAVLQEHE